MTGINASRARRSDWSIEGPCLHWVKQFIGSREPKLAFTREHHQLA